MLDIMKMALQLFIVLATIFAPLTRAHSWVEELTNLAANGSFTGAKGYPRGMVQRNISGFTDTDMQWQLPSNQEDKVTANMTICRQSQQTMNYTAGNPMLASSAGAFIALRYQENGHVTLPYTKTGKPAHSGQVYVYGTDASQADDELLSIHKVWTLDGTGGDGRGRLLTSQYFDDGQCYQINNGPISTERQKLFPRVAEANSIEGANLWCQTDVQLPDDLQENSNYTLYWVWDWPTMDSSGDVTVPELYTTCMDVSIGSDSNPSGSASGSASAIGGKTAAVVAFASVTNYGEAAIQTIFENLAASPTVPASMTPQSTSSYMSSATTTTMTGPSSTSITQSAAGADCSAASTVTTTTTETVTAATARDSTVTATVSVQVTQTITDIVTTTTVVTQTSITTLQSSIPAGNMARRRILAGNA